MYRVYCGANPGVAIMEFFPVIVHSSDHDKLAAFDLVAAAYIRSYKPYFQQRSKRGYGVQ